MSEKEKTMSHRNKPIPADLRAMSIEELKAEDESYRSGDSRTVVKNLIAKRDELQGEIERHATRKLDIGRALIEKYTDALKRDQRTTK